MFNHISSQPTQCAASGNISVNRKVQGGGAEDQVTQISQAKLMLPHCPKSNSSKHKVSYGNRVQPTFLRVEDIISIQNPDISLRLKTSDVAGILKPW